MSRSYRKTPIVKDNPKGSKTNKRIANSFVNSKISTYEEDSALPQNKEYKKIYDTWNIHDCKIRCTLDEHMKEYEQYLYYRDHPEKDPRPEWTQQILKDYPTKKSWKREWIKDYKSK